MSVPDDLAYHRARVRDELNLAMDAAGEAAAAAHLRLSALHLRRIAALARAGRAASGVGSPAIAAALLYAGRCHRTETADA